jgi:hypothetical protein
VTDWLFDSLWGLLVFLALATVILLVAIAVPVVGLSRHYGRIHCNAFAQNTNRPTKFVVYSYVDTGNCLTPDGHGRWIPTSNLREFGSR